MKWKNKGHEFDAHGEYFKKVKRIYLYGAVESAKQIIEHLEFATKEIEPEKKDYDFCFVDRDAEKQKEGFGGLKVISPDEFYNEFSEMNGIVVLCMNETSTQDVWNEISNRGIKRTFNAFSTYEFYRYMSLFVYYKYKKLFLHAVDMYNHTICNLKCKHCCIQHHRGYHHQRSFEEMKENIDYLFQKVDNVGIMFFGIAEGFLGGESLSKSIQYIVENYSDRFMVIEIVTNGTVIPLQGFIDSLKTPKVRVAVDDYTDNVDLARKQIRNVVKLLDENSINYAVLKREYWEEYEFGTTKDLESNKYGEKYRDCICHAKGFAYIGYNENSHRVYSCVHQTINAYLKIVQEDEDDSVSLDECTPLELIEFLLGYSNKGYLSGCAQCNGAFEGAEALHIPVAEQL